MTLLLDILWTLLIYGAVLAVLWWVTNWFAGKLPAPIGMIAQGVMVVAVAVVAICLLLGRLPLIPVLTLGGVR